MKKSMNTVGHNIAMILRGHIPIEKTVKLIGMVTSVTFNNEEIIKELINECDTITVESEKGKGSTFIIKLPLIN